MLHKTEKNIQPHWKDTEYILMSFGIWSSMMNKGSGNGWILKKKNTNRIRYGTGGRSFEFSPVEIWREVHYGKI